MKRSSLALSLLLAAAATPALAHTGHEHTAGLMAGMAHPLFGMDHLLAMLAVGVLALQQGGRGLWLLPLTFVSVMLLGGVMAMAGLAVPGLELGILGSVIMLGLVIGLGRRLPLAASAGMVAFFAVFHGVAHGAEMPLQASAVLYALGFVSMTAALHGAGVLLALASRKLMLDAAPMVLRALGLLTAVAGVGLAAA